MIRLPHSCTDRVTGNACQYWRNACQYSSNACQYWRSHRVQVQVRVGGSYRATRAYPAGDGEHSWRHGKVARRGRIPIVRCIRVVEHDKNDTGIGMEYSAGYVCIVMGMSVNVVVGLVTVR